MESRRNRVWHRPHTAVAAKDKMISRLVLSRIVQITSLRCLMLTVIVYLFLVWLGFRQLESNVTNMKKSGQIFLPNINENGSLQLYANEECHGLHIPVSSYRKNFSLNITALRADICPVQARPLKANIQVEKEWDSISVNYPQYVYTVSGWIQVISVPNYDTSQPLRVIIVPHSHQDPGWKETFDGYFHSYTRNTLENIVKYLDANPKWKFLWSEVSYLEKWFSVPDQGKEVFKKLVANGQIEIVSGGWVMTDESVAHYTAMLDQLIEGHMWLHQHFGITPNTSWSIDPFGHSPTMTYFLKKSGINHMVIQRVHFGIKRNFAKRRNLEFMWRQAWDSDGSTGVLCHIMPFLLYAIHYSCGPDPHVCCQFDFHSDKCFRGTETVSKLTVDDTNIRKLAWALWEQYRKKAFLYRKNVILVPHGDDFRYSSESEWTQQFGNLIKLMEYMNKDKDMNIKIEFGTLSDYFKALEAEGGESKSESFPSLTGDFLPYNDRDDQYWTGFYSVRPLLKHMGRVLQAKTRITEILFSLILAQTPALTRQAYTNHEEIIVEARRTVGLFQHHDAITGTSKSIVMADYGGRLQATMSKVDSLLSWLMLNSVLKQVETFPDLQPNTIFFTEEWNSRTSPPVLKISQFKGKWFVIVVNALTVDWTAPITIRTSTPSIVKTRTGSPVPSQINPVLGPGLQAVAGIYDVVFLASLPGLSVEVFELTADAPSANYASLTLFGNELHTESFNIEFKAKTSGKEIIEIENTLLKAIFSSCTGTLQHVLRRSDDVIYQTTIQMMTYGTGSWYNPFKDKSGAYIFMPDGQAKEIKSHHPSIVLLKGPVVSSVVTKLSGVRHTVSLYNVTGPMGSGVHIDNLVDISSKEWENKELVMRITTDVLSQDSSVCVDLNGFQMHKKKWRSKFLIQGNFHPMTSMAFIEDGKLSRMTLITSESHGFASLKPGSMEVILDRRLMQDDWRGLNEGPHDNTENPSRFILVPERRDSQGQTKGPVCYPSMLAHLLSSHLNNPPQAAFLEDPKRQFAESSSFLQEPWPCLYKLLNLRKMHTPPDSSLKSLMVLHRVGLDCNYRQVHMDCNMQKAVNLNSFKNVHIKSAVETTLTGVKELRPLTDLKLEVKDMEIKSVIVTLT